MAVVYYSPQMEKLKTRNDELSAEIEDIKHHLEQEKIKLKNVKEEKVREIKLAREQEKSNAAQETEELKQKLQRQMQSELMTKVDATCKECETKIALIRKESKKEMESQRQKIEDERKQLEEKLQLEQKKFKEEVLAKNKNEADKFVSTVFQLQKQLSSSQDNNENLKQENNKLKDTLQKQKEKYGKEAGQSDKQFRADHQKQIEELKEKNRQLVDKDRQLSELQRKYTSLQLSKEKVENDLQLSKRLTTIVPSSTGKDEEDTTTEPRIPTKTQREEELLITNSELGVLVKRMRAELEHLKKDKVSLEGKLKISEGVVEPLKKRREEDMKTILDLNHMVDVKEKQSQKIINERNGMKTERDKLKKDLEMEQAALARQKTSDKKDGEITRLKRLLETKAKEMDELLENNAKLNTEIHKLKEISDRTKKEKAESRLNQLSLTGPTSPAVERKVKEHRRLVELEDSMKEMTDKLSESQRSKAKINQRMEDLNESLRRRDKRIKLLTDENHKIKSSNQLLEEARDRTHQETIEEWTRTRTELDRIHAQNNRLHQENMNFRDELLKYTSTIPTSLLSPRHRSRSPSPRQHSNLVAEQRARSLSPGRRQKVLTPQRNVKSPPPRQELPRSISPLRSPTSLNQSSNTEHQTKIPIAAHYVQQISPIRTTSPREHTSKILSPHSPMSPAGYPTSPSIRSPSPLSTSFSPTHSVPRPLVVTLPKVELESSVHFDQSGDHQDDDLGSEISVESLKDRIELYEFEKEEKKIWQDEHMEEFRQLKVKYKILKEKYELFFNQSKDMSNKLQIANVERLEMDREVARLQSERGREFDIKREGNLRDKLNNANTRVKQLEEELLKLITEDKTENAETDGDSNNNNNQERMEEQLIELREHLEQLESQLKLSETQLAKKDEIIITKEKQMVGLERMLAEKEGEIEGERAIVTSLQQKLNNEIVSLAWQQKHNNEVDVSSPRQQQQQQQQQNPQMVNCLNSAQNVIKEVKKSVNSNLTDDQVEQIEGLIEYVHQVLDEAKGHITTPVTPPTATPIDENDGTDSGPTEAMLEQSNNSRYTETTPTLELSPMGRASYQHSNEFVLREKISQLEGQIKYLTDNLKEQDNNDSVREELLLLRQQTRDQNSQLRQLTQDQNSQHEKEKQLLLLQINQLQLLSEKQQEKMNDSSKATPPPTTTQQTTPTLELSPMGRASYQHSNEFVLREKISQLEGQIKYLTDNVKEQDNDDSVREELLLLRQQTRDQNFQLRQLTQDQNSQLRQLTQDQNSQHEKEKQSLLLQLQLLSEKQQEKMNDSSKATPPPTTTTTTTTQQLILPSPTQLSAEKDERFKQWMKKFEKEKKSLNKRIQELETRLGEGSQRVNDLQSLVVDLEGRLSDETDPEKISPSTIRDRDRYIISLTEKVSELEDQLEGQTLDNHLTTPPTSLGFEVNQNFQRTQYFIGQGDLTRSRLELQHLEKSISELLRVVYPKGFVVPNENPWPSISPVSKQATPIHGTPTHLPTTPSPLAISSISPIMVSTSEADPVGVHTQTISVASTERKTTPTRSTNKKAKNEIRLFVTLIDYNPLSLCSTGHPERELSLHTGDVIAVTGEMDTSGFYNGVFEGRRGLVPAKFLEEMEVSDKGTQQRLLNQSLSHNLSSSLHGSEVDMISSPSTHKDTSQLLTHIPHGAGPSPPSQLKVEKSEHYLLVTWRPPTLDINGRSNGYLVTGYSLICNNIPVHASKGGNQYIQQVLLEVNTNEQHTVTMCTKSEEGVVSTDVTAQYIPITAKYSSIRSSQRSNGSYDSDITQTKQMVAVYDYNPTIDSPNANPDLELPFIKGQTITVYGDMRYDGFYHGQLGELYGLVPSNYVVEYDSIQSTHPLITDPHPPMMKNPSHVWTPPQQTKRKLFGEV